MHWHEPLRSQVFEYPYRFIRPHVDTAKGFRVISANWQQGYLRRAGLANILEPLEIRTVARMINPAALIFEEKTAIPPVMVTQSPRAPVFTRRQCDSPIPVRKA